MALAIFDLDNWRFSGSPTLANAGNFKIQITAKDIHEGTVSDSFIIRVEGPPFVKTNLTNQQVKTTTFFSFIINNVLQF